MLRCFSLFIFLHSVVCVFFSSVVSFFFAYLLIRSLWLYCVSLFSSFSLVSFSLAVLLSFELPNWQYKRTHTHTTVEWMNTRSQAKKECERHCFCSFLPLPFECVFIFRSLSFAIQSTWQIDCNTGCSLARTRSHFLFTRETSNNTSTHLDRVRCRVVSFTLRQQDRVPLTIANVRMFICLWLRACLYLYYVHSVCVRVYSHVKCYFMGVIEVGCKFKRKNNSILENSLLLDIVSSHSLFDIY